MYNNVLQCTKMYSIEYHGVKWRSPTFFPQTRRDVDPDACLTEDIVSFNGERNQLISVI